MHPRRRWLVGIVVIGLLLAVVYVFRDQIRPLAAYAWYRITDDYPKNETQSIGLEGLSEPVRVYLNSAGIPHIDAANVTDLVLATGYMHGRDRFFEMDLLRRLARGRVAELLGEQKFLWSTTLDFDRAMRGWGFEAAAEHDARELAQDLRQTMEAYASGVNAAIEQFTPVEYRLLGVEPQPWTPADSFALGRLNGWSVSHNWQQELSRFLLAIHGGIDRTASIYPSEPWSGYSSLPAKEAPHPLPPAVAAELEALFPPKPYDSKENRSAARGVATVHAGMTAASNSWVVSGARSGSGLPVAAGDPHLTHLLPSLVVQQHLRCPDFDVIGVTIPGLPQVLAGHNTRVAWNMTAATADVIDLYIEQQNPGNPNEVMGLDGFQALEVVEEVFRVRHGTDTEEHRFTFRRSRHGPLLNDLYPNLFPEDAPLLALCSLETRAGASIAAGFKAARARDVFELRDALRGMASPPTVWTAADVDGNIALFATGTIPLRQRHLGTFPAPGWQTEYDWKGELLAADLPWGANSAEGFFAHCNNMLIDPETSAFLYHVDSAPAYRVERVAALIRGSEKHSIDSFQRIQADTYLHRAERLTPILLADLAGVSGLSPIETSARNLLEAWDFNAPADSAATAIFFVTYREAAMEALLDEVDGPAGTFLLAQRYMSNAYDKWFQSPGHVVWDHRGTDAVETRPQVIREAFRRAVVQLEEGQGTEPSQWRWGRLHDLHLQHPFGSLPRLGGFFNLPHSETGGGPASVWKSHSDFSNPDAPFRATAGPVIRMIVDLADIEHGLWVLDTGASGWPGSPHYGDQHARWKTGEYLPMVSNWEELRAQAVPVLTLK